MPGDIYTSYISAGRLDVSGNIYVLADGSGTIASTINAVKISAGSITASTIKATSATSVSSNVVSQQTITSN